MPECSEIDELPKYENCSCTSSTNLFSDTQTSTRPTDKHGSATTSSTSATNTTIFPTTPPHTPSYTTTSTTPSQTHETTFQMQTATNNSLTTTDNTTASTGTSISATLAAIIERTTDLSILSTEKQIEGIACDCVSGVTIDKLLTVSTSLIRQLLCLNFRS